MKIENLEELEDLVIYKLADDGRREDTDITAETLEANFDASTVLLICRYDLRRIFIWKGPKSPVRQRFISSRVAAKLQEAAASARGMHMKIVSVDAGDEPVEFLSAFQLQPYVITDEEKPEELYYITNMERRKMEEEQYAQETQKKNKEKEKKEYWSPLLEEQKRQGKEVPNVGNLTAKKQKSLKKLKKMEKRTPLRKKSRRRVPVPTTAAAGFSEEKIQEILKTVITRDVPEGMKRLNIIIGSDLYGPSIIKQEVFGKEVTKEKWEKIGEIPEGEIIIGSNELRVITEKNQILAMEVLQNLDSEVKIEQSEKQEKSETPEEKKKPAELPKVKKLPGKKDPKKKRELRDIPSG